MQKIPFDIARFFTDISGKLTHETLNGVQSFLSKSMQWTGESFQSIAELPIINTSDLSVKLKQTGKDLFHAEKVTSEELTAAIIATGSAFRTAIESLNLADETTRKALFENIHASSIVGESFLGISISDIIPSFRLNSKDASPREIAMDFEKSGFKKIAILFPGLLCDETLWENSKSTPSLEKVLREKRIYPIKLRFNPGIHISQNGKSALTLLHELLSLPPFQNKATYVLTYSQGGLIFRSMLYYSMRQDNDLPNKIHKAILVSSPDGGSYLEKLGFWLGFTMENLPLPFIKLLGIIGNQRSDAIKDLSHGIIREEDWMEKEHLKRYIKKKYFGELDNIDAYQIFSLVSEDENPLHSWIGDGVVETRSLTYLSDIVYRKKNNPNKRIFYLKGHSHFSTLSSKEVHKKISEIFT